MTSSAELDQASAKGRAAGGTKWGHIWLVATTYVRFALRTGAGVMFIFVFVTGTLGLAGGLTQMVKGLLTAGAENQTDLLYPVYLQLTTKVNRLVAAEYPPEVLNDMLALMTASKATEESSPEAWYLLVHNPGLLSVLYILLLLMLPITACMVGFGQTSVDAGNRGLRFLLLRTERYAVFFGRYLGTVIYVALSMIGCMLIICGYFHLGLDAFEPLAVWRWGAQCSFGAFLMVVPYLALCAWISGASNGGFKSLILCFAVCIGSVVVIYMVNASIPAPLGIDVRGVLRLFPFGWKDDLLSVNLGRRLLAYTMMLVFTAIYLGLGYRHFNRRDL